LWKTEQGSAAGQTTINARADNAAAHSPVEKKQAF
jgi:hypothetical protein